MRKKELKPRVDLTNIQFGSRKVISWAGFDKHGHSSWNVVCLDCNRAFSCLSQTLRRTKLCRYCRPDLKQPRPNRRKRPYEVNYNSLIQRARHPVLITYEQFAEFSRIKECHYCGEEIVWIEYRQKGKGAASNLDRKDSTKPYEVDNIVVCCARCNYAKNTHFTYEEWKKLGSVIRSWRTS